jgi:hypothetical protein
MGEGLTHADLVFARSPPHPLETNNQWSEAFNDASSHVGGVLGAHEALLLPISGVLVNRQYFSWISWRRARSSHYPGSAPLPLKFSPLHHFLTCWSPIK